MAFDRWGDALGLQPDLRMMARHYPLLADDLDDLTIALNGAVFDFLGCRKKLLTIKKRMQTKADRTTLVASINQKTKEYDETIFNGISLCGNAQRLRLCR
jgi:glutamine phosphoribosylpyrophosphate amidotransferase